MLEQLESNYDCANAGDDLHKLKQELAQLRGSSTEDQETMEKINRIENQISFIMNKCDIHH